MQHAIQCNAADVPPFNAIVGTPVFLSSGVIVLQASSRRSLTPFFIPPLSFCLFSLFSAPLLPNHFSLFLFSVRLLPLSPLARLRMPARINELGHGFLSQRELPLRPHQLEYNRFEATAISDMRVQTNRQYSLDYTLFLSFPRQAQ